MVDYELLRPNETITKDLYRLQMEHLSRVLKGKRPFYVKRYNNGILQHDSAWSHMAKLIKKQGRKNNDFLVWAWFFFTLTRYLFQWRMHIYKWKKKNHFHSYKEVKNWVDLWIASKGIFFFNLEGHPYDAREMRKK